MILVRRATKAETVSRVEGVKMKTDQDQQEVVMVQRVIREETLEEMILLVVAREEVQENGHQIVLIMTMLLTTWLTNQTQMLSPLSHVMAAIILRTLKNWS